MPGAPFRSTYVGLWSAAKISSVGTSNNHEMIEIYDSDNDDMHSNDESHDGSEVTQSESQSTSIICNNVCCSDENNFYQPKDSKTLVLFTNKNCQFLQVWYDRYRWLTLCIAKKKIFCINCKYAQSHKLLTFLKRSNIGFTTTGFSNYMKV